jgi:hypothetical protein
MVVWLNGGDKMAIREFLGKKHTYPHPLVLLASFFSCGQSVGVQSYNLGYRIGMMNNT